MDPEPDFWARSARGPWHIAVNEDCAQQFKAKYGDLACIRIQHTDIPVLRMHITAQTTRWLSLPCLLRVALDCLCIIYVKK